MASDKNSGSKASGSRGRTAPGPSKDTFTTPGPGNVVFPNSGGAGATMIGPDTDLVDWINQFDQVENRPQRDEVFIDGSDTPAQKPAGAVSGAANIESILANETFWDAPDNMVNPYLEGLYNLQSNWTQAQKDAMAIYKGSGYMGMNGVLRDSPYIQKYAPQTIANIKKSNEALISAMRPLPDNIVVRRGMNDYAGFIKAYQNGTLIGNAFTDKGFGSTSLGSSAAFSMYNVQMTVRLPRGTRVGVPNPTGLYGSEREILVHPNAKYRINGATMKGNTLFLEVDYIGEGD